MQRAILGCHLAAMLGWTLISVVQAQGPAPSPLILGPSPPPAQVPAVAPETSPGPELTKADFDTFLDALIPSQLPQRDRLRICFRNCKIEVTANVAVEIEFALFDQLHHGC